MGQTGIVIIRPERSTEFDAIRDVVDDAFGVAEGVGALVDRIRASPFHEPELALVAVDDGAVVGHVMVSWARLRHSGGERRLMMLSPLAVTPDRHRSGIGGALVRAVTALVDRRAEPVVVLEGSPTYYARFGFVDGRDHGIHITLPDGAPRDAGQVLRLSSFDPADPTWRGDVVYPPAFDGVD